MHNLTRAEAQRRAEQIDVARYAVELDLTTGEETFHSVAEVRFSCREPGAATFVEILAPTVHSIELNGRPLDPDVVLQGDRVTLTGLAGSNVLRVVADCAYSRTGEGLHRFVDPADGAVYLYSQAFLYDAHRIFACFDQPDLKAPFELTVVAPPEWTCISNSSVAEAADGCWRFAPTPPVSTYFTVLAAGPYAGVHDRHGDIDLGVYCRRSLEQHLDADEILDVTKASFDHYQRVFDYPYAFGKYDQLFVPEFNAGAMENPGAVTIRDEYVFRSKVTDAARQLRAETIAHEMAHMWFGDLVSMRWWNDLWLNESFATYMAYPTLVEGTRFTNSWTTFCNLWKAAGYRADQLPSTHPVSTDVADTDSALLNFDGISYGKGAAVLKQLVAWVGWDPFVAGIRQYFRNHEFANTTLADLLAALERASGRDLGAWSAQWLRTTGVNTLRPSLTTADGTFTSVAVEQSAADGHPTLRAHRIAIGLYDRVGDALLRRQRVECDVSGPRTEVPELVGVEQPDLLLVNDDDLTYAKIRFDDRSLVTVLDAIGKLRESLPRTLCWNAAWDMTRDGELSTRDYVRLVMGGVAAEDDIGVAQSLLTNARNASDSYAEPAHRPQLMQSLARLSREVMRSATPGGDLQLAHARAFTLAASAEDDVAAVAAMLDGSDVPAGLEVDTEMRWHLLQRLVVLGRAGSAEIDRELERDRTAAGEQQAATARAARPDPSAKAAAWSALVESDNLSNRLVTSTAGGFWSRDHLELGRPYVDRYFDALSTLWSSRTPEIAQRLTTLLYPSLLVEDETLGRTDAYLSGDEMPPGLRRLLSERRDEVARAVRARACDAAAGPLD